MAGILKAFLGGLSDTMGLAREIAKRGPKDGGGLTGSLAQAKGNRTFTHMGTNAAKALEKEGLEGVTAEQISKFKGAFKDFGKGIDAASDAFYKMDLSQIDDDLMSAIRKRNQGIREGFSKGIQFADMAEANKSQIRNVAQFDTLDPLAAFEKNYDRYAKAADAGKYYKNTMVQSGLNMKRMGLQTDDIQRGMRTADTLNGMQTMFSGTEGKKRLAAVGAAYAGVNVAGRYISGGTLTRNNDGERDIAGIPFI